MINILRQKLYKVSCFLEVVVGAIAIIPIIIAMGALCIKIMSNNVLDADMLNAFIYRTFEIIIAIEFVKLIFAHTIDATIEVIIMAIVRQIIVEHTTFLETFVLVLAIGVLFGVRKYLFIRELDKLESFTDKENSVVEPKKVKYFIRKKSILKKEEKVFSNRRYSTV